MVFVLLILYFALWLPSHSGALLRRFADLFVTFLACLFVQLESGYVVLGLRFFEADRGVVCLESVHWIVERLGEL